MSSSGKPLTTGQAARYCHVTIYTVLNWIKSGKMKAYATPGGQYRIKLDDMRSFLEKYGMPIPDELGEAHPRKVLLVDDEAMVIEVMQGLLVEYDANCQIQTASDGVEALLKIGTFKPDLLVLDLRMPRMDGCDVCRHIRENPSLQDVKILVVTGYSADPRLTEALHVGANDWLAKPFDSELFITKIQSLLG